MSRPTGPISGTFPLVPNTITEEGKIGERMAMQIATSDNLTDIEAGFNAVAIPRGFRPIRDLNARTALKKGQKEETQEGGKVEAISKSEETRTRFGKQRQGQPEIDKEKLILFLTKIKEVDSPADILVKFFEGYKDYTTTAEGLVSIDYTVVDEALSFLSEKAEGAIKENIDISRTILKDVFQIEIQAGYVATPFVQEAKEDGYIPTDMRDLYRQVTGTPNDPLILFDQLSQKYPFTDLKKIIRFLLHALGADIKSEGPTIDRGKLYKLMSDTRTLQAILWVYLFFRSRMPMLYKQLKKENILPAQNMTFENLAKTFIKIVQERYLSPERLKFLARNFGALDKKEQIASFVHLRDASRQVAPKLFPRGDKQKEEILAVVNSLLEELEE